MTMTTTNDDDDSAYIAWRHRLVSKFCTAQIRS